MLPQCLFCLSLYMFLYKRWTESPVSSLQISVEPYFLNFRMLFPKLITDYRQTNDRLVTDIVNISKSVIPLYSYTSTIYAK